ncbi:MAG TPA: histidine kinase [Gemmatimonadales bacterium]|jgi:signal transduction histidine kinase|nr:histidine kinase [Gemmatimonadales bacterium]
MSHALAAIPGPRPGRAGRIPWRLILGVGAGYGLLTSAQQHLSSALSGRAYPWWMSFALQMPIAAAWAVATPGILWLGRRFPLPARRWPLNAAVHLAACLSFVFLLDLGSAWYWPHLMPLPPDAKPLLARAARLFVVWIFSDGLLYWTILAVSSAADHYRRFRERELTASQLETQLARADLQGLKMQLHPHFLFNALHTIGSLVRTGDRDNAVKVTAGLGDLLRRMLDGAAQQEVPLKQELDFIRSYLDIEQIRFRDRLQVSFQVDPEVLDAKVPHLILQPLVENAIRHGIAPHLFAGRISVGARKVNGRLQLVVRDDGPGVGDGDAARPGIGLSNSRARLARLYGEDFTLEVSNLPQGGLQARVELPFHLAPADWEGET